MSACSAARADRGFYPLHGRMQQSLNVKLILSPPIKRLLFNRSGLFTEGCFSGRLKACYSLALRKTPRDLLLSASASN